MTDQRTASEFEGSMPHDLLTHLDFVSSLLIIVLSYAFHKMGLMKDVHIPGLRAATFTFALPALNLSLLWKADITSEVAIVLIMSLVTSTCSMILALGLSLLAHPINRGFYAMALCGNSIAFVYPTLLSSDRFGAETVPVAIMLELGGNVWVANIYMALVGRVFVPSSKKDDDVKVKPYLPSGDDLQSAQGVPPFTQFGAVGGDQQLSCPSDTIALDQVSSSCGSTSVEPPDTTKAPSVLVLLARNVLLWAIFVGLLLNVSGAPYLAVPGKSLEMLGTMFGPLLYAIIGTELKFDLGFASYGVVMRVLVCRWLCNGVAVGVVRLLPWGVSHQIQGALTLCMLTPLPSTFVMYTGLYGYRSDQAAVMYSIAAVVSLAVISFLTPLV